MWVLCQFVWCVHPLYFQFHNHIHRVNKSCIKHRFLCPPVSLLFCIKSFAIRREKNIKRVSKEKKLHSFLFFLPAPAFINKGKYCTCQEVLYKALSFMSNSIILNRLCKGIQPAALGYARCVCVVYICAQFWIHLMLAVDFYVCCRMLLYHRWQDSRNCRVSLAAGLSVSEFKAPEGCICKTGGRHRAFRLFGAGFPMQPSIGSPMDMTPNRTGEEVNPAIWHTPHWLPLLLKKITSLFYLVMG